MVYSPTAKALSQDGGRGSRMVKVAQYVFSGTRLCEKFAAKTVPVTTPPCHFQPTNQDSLTNQGPPTSGHIHKIRYGMEERFAFHFPSDDQRPVLRKALKKVSKIESRKDIATAIDVNFLNSSKPWTDADGSKEKIKVQNVIKFIHLKDYNARQMHVEMMQHGNNSPYDSCEQNISESIFEEEIPALYGKDIGKVDLYMDKASNHTSKSTAAYLAKNQKQEYHI
ncbi:hypothetical protein TNCV_4717601 [Trichonephila clavipes]|nr:hypothetical protein TNCV_4717601 [Trichonephila clavipes]